MVGSLAAISLAIWYYTGAQKKSKDPVKWAFIGVLIYFIGAVLWSYLITPPLRDSVEHSQSYILGFIVRFGYVAAGVACSGWVKFKHLDADD